MRADEIEIPEPCPIDLRAHVAGAREQFHCERCDRSVHVLSNMSEEAAARVLERRTRDNLCVAFLRAPDGEVAFRKPPARAREDLVPTSRLRRSREVLRASALVLGVAACSPDDGSGGFLGLRGGGDEAGHEVLGGPPPPPRREVARAEGAEDEPCDKPGVGRAGELEILAGAPPSHDAPGLAQLASADDDPLPVEPAQRRVDIDELDARDTPQPALERLLETRAGRERRPIELTVEHCVDLAGSVVDAKITAGDAEVGAVLLETMKLWRYRPYRIDGEAVRVCTEHKIRLSFDVAMERLPT